MGHGFRTNPSRRVMPVLVNMVVHVLDRHARVDTEHSVSISNERDLLARLSVKHFRKVVRIAVPVHQDLYHRNRESMDGLQVVTVVFSLRRVLKPRRHNGVGSLLEVGLAGTIL